MARHRRRRSYHGRHKRGHRRHHRFGDIAIGKVLRESVPVGSLAMGGGVGLAGALGAIYGLNKYNAKRAANKQSAIGFSTDGAGNPVPAMWLPFLPAIGGVAIGLAGFAIRRKKNRRQAVAILGGASIAGALVTVFQWAKTKWAAQFGDYVKVRLSGYGNVLVQQGALGNMLVTMPVTRAAGSGLFPARPTGRASMGQLSLAAMSPAARSSAGYLRTRV